MLDLELKKRECKWVKKRELYLAAVLICFHAREWEGFFLPLVVEEPRVHLE